MGAMTVRTLVLRYAQKREGDANRYRALINKKDIRSTKLT